VGSVNRKRIKNRVIVGGFVRWESPKVGAILKVASSKVEKQNATPVDFFARNSLDKG
jgi:hypothetical protein